MPPKSSDKKMKRIGILTGGGDCPGLNAVIRAVVWPAVTNTSVCSGSLEVYGFLDSYAGLVYGKFMKLDLENTADILIRGGTILYSSNKDNPFDMVISDRGGELKKKDLSDSALETYNDLELDALVAIGGDGTMAIANRFAAKGMNVVGVPKTIDNDLAATDVTFGFDTAVTTATDAIDKIRTTAHSHHRVMLVELMGRYAGWLTLHAGVAGGADVILLPEFPYDINKVCAKIKECFQNGRGCAIVAVAEGARSQGGEMVVERTVKGSHDPIRLGGIGKALAKEIEAKMGTQFETRVTVLGHVQRGGSPTPHDRNLSSLFGTAAIELVLERKFGRMVCLQGGKITSVTLEEATRNLKFVKEDNALLRTAKALGVCLGV